MAAASFSATFTLLAAFGLISTSVLAGAESPRKFGRGAAFSTSAAQVNGRHVLLDECPSETYTHYFQSQESVAKFNFTVHVRRNGTGIFINSWELVDNKTTVDSLGSSTRKKTSEICWWYSSIKFSYPDDEGKEPTYMCKGAKYKDELKNLVALEDYEGPGSVLVEVTLTYLAYNPYLRTFPRPGTAETPWRSVFGRSIPSSSIGGLTFTLYQDCSKQKPFSLRPCSTFHNTTCISGDLFCNGELNCVTTLRDTLAALELKPTNVSSSANANASSSDFERETTPSFDESGKTCGGTSHRFWTKETTTYTYSYTKNAETVEGRYVGKLVGGIAFTILLAGIGAVGKALKGSGSGSGGAEEEEARTRTRSPNEERQGPG